MQTELKTQQVSSGYLAFLGWVGVPLTKLYGRRGMRPRGAGSAAFFTTFGVIALVLGVVSVANLSHM
ncbi:hypothetical protein [Kribbella sp. NPDC051718]|uniref:hypothetical protein n=1 Tax=Kribbella sp. NPDC051718 TaxID=3155168 RepID=UPI00343F9771